MDNNSYKDMADDKITSFDKISSSDHIRMLKILLHYIPEAFRKNLSVYIKYLELQHVLNAPSHFTENDHRKPSSTAETFQAENSRESNADYSNHIPGRILDANFNTLIHELLPYCSPRERQKFQGIENMINSFEQMKNMMEMFEMMKDMKDMFGDGEGGFNPDMLAGMMGMDGFDFSNLSNMFGGSE